MQFEMHRKPKIQYKAISWYDVTTLMQKYQKTLSEEIISKEGN